MAHHRHIPRLCHRCDGPMTARMECTRCHIQGRIHCRRPGEIVANAQPPITIVVPEVTPPKLAEDRRRESWEVPLDREDAVGEIMEKSLAPVRDRMWKDELSGA